MENNQKNQQENLNMDLVLQGEKPKKNRWKILFLFFGLLLIGGVIGWYYLFGKQTLTPPVQYATEPVKKGDIRVTITAIGNVQPRTQVDIGTELSGTVQEVFVDENDRVTKGQKLASLNTDQLVGSITKARAALISAKARVTQAKTQITKAEADALQAEINVQQSMADAQQAVANTHQANTDIQQAELNLRQNQTNVQQAKNDLTQAKANLQRTQLDYHKTNSGIKQAEANVKSAYAALHQARNKWQQSKIKPSQDQLTQQKLITEYDQRKRTTLENRKNLNRLLELQKNSGGKLPAQQEIDTATNAWQAAVAAESSAQLELQAAKLNAKSTAGEITSDQANVDSAQINLEYAKANQEANKMALAPARADIDIVQARIGIAKQKVDNANAEALAAQLKLNDAKAKAAVIQANALVAKKKIELAKAQVKTAKADQVNNASNLEAAKASVVEAEADLRSAESKLAQAVILSPIDGVVLSRSVELGQTVVSSSSVSTLFKLAEDLKRMVLKVDINEVDVSQLKPDQQAEFTVDAWPNRKYPAQVTRVSLSATTEKNIISYKTMLELDNSDLSLRPGMTATVIITTQAKENVLLVPNTALRFTPPLAGSATPDETKSESGLLSRLFSGSEEMDDDQEQGPVSSEDAQNIWVLENNQPKSIAIKTGISDGKVTEVISGDLTEKMQVITNTKAMVAP